MKKIILSVLITFALAALVAAQNIEQPVLVEKRAIPESTGSYDSSVKYVDSLKIIDTAGKPIEGLKVRVVKFVLDQESASGAGHSPDQSTSKEYTTDKNGMIDLGFKITKSEKSEYGYEKYFYNIDPLEYNYRFSVYLLTPDIGQNPIIITATKILNLPLKIKLSSIPTIYARYNSLGECSGLGSGTPDKTISLTWFIEEGSKYNCFFVVYDILSEKADYQIFDSASLNTQENTINLALDKSLQDVQDKLDAFNKKEEDYVIYKGWNLLNTGSVTYYNSQSPLCLANDLQQSFAYIINPLTNTYITGNDAAKDPSLQKELGPVIEARGYYMMWYPSFTNCRGILNPPEIQKIELKEGKNVIPVVKFFRGLDLKTAIKSKCPVERASLWDYKAQGWMELEDDYRFTGEEQGMVIKSTSSCVLEPLLDLPGLKPPSIETFSG